MVGTRKNRLTEAILVTSLSHPRRDVDLTESTERTEAKKLNCSMVIL